MRIQKLIIKAIHQDLFSDNVTEINFGNITLITSAENGTGKTSLLRFLLYSFGYTIPSTQGFDMKNYSTELYLEYNDNIRLIKRIENKLTITFEDNVIIEFNLGLDKDKKKSIATIFEVDNTAILPFLLGTFYMDQDKGWKLFNRGKVIGIHSFYIEAFIFALENEETNLEFYGKIKNLEDEIERYSAISDVYKLKSNVRNNKPINKQTDLAKELLLKKATLNYDIDQLSSQIYSLKQITTNNEYLGSMIENYKLLISYEGKDFVLKKSHIKNFEANQNITNVDISDLKIEKEELGKQLEEIIVEIEKTHELLSVKELSDELINEIHDIPLNEVNLKELIFKKKKELSELKKQENEAIQTNAHDVYSFLKEKIKKYTQQLGVFEYIEKDDDYVLTRNLKAYSGVTLHKLALSYKLAYYDCIKKYLNIEIPFIIDSPGTGEATDANINLMMQVLYHNFQNSQIIIASLKVEDINIQIDKKIFIEGRLMEKRNY